MSDSYTTKENARMHLETAFTDYRAAALSAGHSRGDMAADINHCLGAAGLALETAEFGEEDHDSAGDEMVMQLDHAIAALETALSDYKSAAEGYGHDLGEMCTEIDDCLAEGGFADLQVEES